ncbi:hypothetical protein [Saccharicrinis aurantiacus]|uniref:hypothetical protein n=1 Tax=Saccharicrinis aurantiacus TaxID=1849719 RepID=UPI002491CAA0|nr:hypothetical protein [Saccharicrinis aurantiacus]
MLIKDYKNKFYTFLSICLYYFVAMFQGVDVCDEGFALSSYQQIFNCPESIEYNMLFWLTTVLGGLWHTLFPDGGIISFRILGATTLLLTSIISYKTLKEYLPIKYVLLSILMIVVSDGFADVSFNYNFVTGLVSVITLFLFYKGLIQQKKLFLFIAGITTSLCLFTSLPAITLAAIFLVIPFFQIINSEIKTANTLRNLVFYLLGIVLGTTLVLIIIKILGHWEIFTRAIYLLSSHSSSPDSNHNLATLLIKFIKDYLRVIYFALTLISGSIFFLIARNQLKGQVLKITCDIIAFLFFAVLLHRGVIYTLYAMCILGCVSVIINKSYNHQYRVIAFGALITAIILPLGTDPGIHSIGYASIWMSLPFIFIAVNSIDKFSICINLNKIPFTININKGKISHLTNVYLLSYFLFMIISVFNGAYFDDGSRLKKTFIIDSPLANRVYTTQSRSIIINTGLNKLKEVVSPNDYLLVYDKLPLFHYLTQTKPYLYNPWVWAYDSPNFITQLERAEREISVKPVVLVQKYESIMSFSEPVKNYLDPSAEDTYLNRTINHKALLDFLSRNNYFIHWENEYYTIYVVDE